MGKKIEYAKEQAHGTDLIAAEIVELLLSTRIIGDVFRFRKVRGAGTRTVYLRVISKAEYDSPGRSMVER